VTERDERGANAADAPLLTTAYASGEPGSFPPARALARAFPLGDDGRRIVLAVAVGIGDPPSAEAQALEALGQLEAIAAQATAAAPARATLQAGYDAADAAIVRLKNLPGSAQHAGVVMVAALIDGVTATFATLGTPAALLRRDNAVRRLTPPAVRGKRALGLGGPVAPEFSGPVDLAPGDTLLLCTQGVTRDLGEDVIEAVLEEYGPQDAAHDLADLAAQQPGSDGAAVALLHLPGARGRVGAAPLPVAAPLAVDADAPVFVPATVEEPPRRLRGSDRSPAWLTLALLALAIVVGAVAVLAVVRWQGGLGASSSSKATATAPPTATQQALAPGLPIVGSPTVIAAPGSPVASAAAARPTGTPAIRPAAASPGASPRSASPVPAVASATLPPIASLAACDSTNATPCRYTAQSGDSMSVIGDRFSLSAGCFVAANSAHVGIPVTLPTPTIGLGEDYVIPSPGECAAREAAGGAAAATPTPAPLATPKPACTPHPGATAPPPNC
jgi:PPM family protein phosphatase